jgi:hypothetical protein
VTPWTRTAERRRELDADGEERRRELDADGEERRR